MQALQQASTGQQQSWLNSKSPAGHMHEEESLLRHLVTCVGSSLQFSDSEQAKERHVGAMTTSACTAADAETGNACLHH